MLSFRILGAEDYDLIIDIWTRAGLSHRPHGRDSREHITREITGGTAVFVVAYEGEMPAGIVLLTDDGRKGWINRLAVLPEHRRKGIGLALIAEAERIFKGKGRRIIGILIEDWNKPSFELFKKAEYVVHEDITYLSKRESEEV